jgi:putative PEP-CTERM system histidine kinase
LLWSLYIAYSLNYEEILSISKIFAIESLRNLAWYSYLLVLITCIRHENSYLFLIKKGYAMGIVIFSLAVFFIELIPFLTLQLNTLLGFDPRLLLHIIFAIIGLVLVEQLYRNSPQEQRWQIKFTCVAVGGIFIFDFIIYSKALLFTRLDYELWNIRGFINALLVPFLLVSIKRLKNQTKIFHLSRKAVFHSATLLTTGAYLIIMSLAGYYIKHWGGQWGSIAQIVFVFLGFLILFILLFSGKLRALLKVFLNKHFVHYRYDYREQWLNISKSLAELDSFSHLSAYIIKTLAGIVESTGGGLWIKNKQGDYYLVEDFSIGFKAKPLISQQSELIVFLTEKKWVVDLYEYQYDPGIYDEVDLSYWLDEEKNIWLISPLFQHQILQGFVVLTKGHTPRKLNWEDHDLLKTIGMQLANALVLQQASEELSIAKQFEAYNRLSAFVVHDLKNVIGQISLIIKNSQKHKNNPEFIDDAIVTLENSVTKMQNLVQQLKQGKQPIRQKKIDLLAVLKKVVQQQSNEQPIPELQTELVTCEMFGEVEQISSVLLHLIQNAQQATMHSGFVTIQLQQTENEIIIKITDNGVGMDNKFIEQRLFKPFDTTKGNAGMGIGVYEAKTYIQQHSGSITVESVLGEGTCFSIVFPGI